MSAEILEIQNKFFRTVRTRAEVAIQMQATISKRQLLNFVEDIKSFCDEFIDLNERTITEMKGEAECQKTQE